MKTLKMIVSILVILFLLIVINQLPKLKLISGFAAKNAASSFFIAKRTLEYTNRTDNNSGLIKLATSKIDLINKTATANVFNLFPKKAIYRKGLGVTLVNNNTVLDKKHLQPKRNFTPINLPYPHGNLPPEKSTFDNIDYNMLDSIVNNCFVENNTNGIKNTRAILVLHKGKIIVEKYAEAFDEHSLLQGWSITKSLLTTCFGVLEKEQGFDINKPIVDFPTWKNDTRKNITTSHLLRMESGLEWEEDYTKICDVTKMLFNDEDVTKRPLSKKQEQPVETSFNYASGSSNILSALLRKQFATLQEYLDYPYQKIIDKIGMHSMLLETDIKGNYIASSYSWATTRDWGKFGQLMLQNGKWNDAQIVNKKWVDYIRTPNKTSDGEYGGQWWLNDNLFMPNVPKDCYYADGFQGQRIMVIPSKDLVVVRFGITELSRVEFYPLFDDLVGTICKSIK